MADREPGCRAVNPGAACTRTEPGGYCLPPRCMCGACPWRANIATHTPDSYTAYDRKAILSSTGRRTSLAEYRAAQGSKR